MLLHEKGNISNRCVLCALEMITSKTAHRVRGIRLLRPSSWRCFLATPNMLNADAYHSTHIYHSPSMKFLVLCEPTSMHCESTMVKRPKSEKLGNNMHIHMNKFPLCGFRFKYLNFKFSAYVFDCIAFIHHSDSGFTRCARFCYCFSG